MKRAEVKVRIEELSAFLMYGAASDALAGSQLWERMIEGGGVGDGGGGGNQFGAYRATASMAATARAIEDGLDAAEQRTVFVVFFAGHAGRELQAAVLDIKKAALMGRLTRIYRKIGAWFSGAGKAQRAAVRTESETKRIADMMAQYQADLQDLNARRAKYWKAKAEARAADKAKCAAPGDGDGVSPGGNGGAIGGNGVAPGGGDGIAPGGGNGAALGGGKGGAPHGGKRGAAGAGKGAPARLVYPA